MKKQTFFWYLAAAGSIFVFWYLAAVVIAKPLVPSPLKVTLILPQLFMQEISVHCLYSLWRILAGLLLAIIIGYPLGLLMGYTARGAKFLSPLVYLTYPTPKIALIPIVMLAVGVGETSKIIMIFLIIVFQVIVAVRDSIKNIPAAVFYSLNSLGAGFGDIFLHILWPASLPKFITAVRIAMATAISVLFFTETFGTKYGMGYFIMDAWLRVNYLEMYAGIVVLSFVGLGLFMLIDAAEYYFCRWQIKKNK